MIRVSIILVNYNTAALLTNAVRSVMSNTRGIEYEIIIVDNHSSDNSGELLTAEFGSGIRYVQLPENIGFGRANNAGMEVASTESEYIFLLNPDTLLVNNAIKILADYLDTHPKAGVAGGNLFDENMNPIYSYHKIMAGIWTDEMALWTLGLNKLVIPHLFHNKTDKPIRVGNVSGADMMVRRNVLDQVGLFDPIFFMYSEETELSYRIRKAGYQVMNVPQAKIIHLEGQSFEFRADRIRRLLESRAKYYRKTRGNIYLQWANRLLFGGLRFRIVFHTFFQPNKKQYFRVYLQTAKQTYCKQ